MRVCRNEYKQPLFNTVKKYNLLLRLSVTLRRQYPKNSIFV